MLPDKIDSKGKPPIEEVAVSKEKCWHWPSTGKFATVFNLWMLLNTLVQAFFVIARCAFEDKPNWYSLYLEIYMNIVFGIGFVRNFVKPYLADNTAVYGFCDIALHYIKTWLLVDLFCFIPIA